jgi:hypothetical protein
LEIIAPSNNSSFSSSSSSSNGVDEGQQCITTALQGVVYQLQPADQVQANPNSSSSSSSSTEQPVSTPWVLQPQGWLLQPGTDIVKALPGWPAAVQQYQARQQLPQQPLLLQSVSKVYTAAALQAAVQQNSAFWRDGSGTHMFCCNCQVSRRVRMATNTCWAADTYMCRMRPCRTEGWGCLSTGRQAASSSACVCAGPLVPGLAAPA